MLIDLLFNGSYYHLWYMVGVIYSMVMIYLICKFKLTKALLPLAVFAMPLGFWERRIMASAAGSRL